MSAKEKDKPKAKPNIITLVSCERTRKRIQCTWTKGDEDHKAGWRDNPLPGLTKAFDALAPIAASICHFPKAYSETGLRVVGLYMDTKGGVDTVSFDCRKDIDDASKEFSFCTPERLLEMPLEEGEYKAPISKESAALVREAVDQAKLYIKGERTQGEIVYDDGKDVEEDNEEKKGDLFTPGDSGKDVKAKGAK